MSPTGSTFIPRVHFTPWPSSELSGIAGQDPKIRLNTATMAVKGIAGPRPATSQVQNWCT